jgi:upstream activation factor subunit UAF30
MARNSKPTKTTESAPAPLPEPVVEVSTPAPIVEKASKPKKSKAPKTEEPVLEVSTPEPAPSPVVDEVVPESTEGLDVAVESSLTEQSTEFLGKLNQLSTLISSLKVEYRTLEKKWSRELKTAQKLSSRRKRKSGNRAPSGFVKPTKISDELAAFLGKEKGTEMARTSVTRDINNYIRTNSLQDKDNGRKIIPDAKLATLLKLSKTDDLTYFNLQRYMSPHFSKNVKVEVVA